MKLEDFQSSPLWQSDSDLRAKESIYNEIWIDGEYDRFGVSVSNGDIVVDCGANIGIFSQYAIHKGAKEVYSYECGDEEYKYLKINTKNNNRIKVFKGYVSDKDYNVEKIINDNNLSHIDFLKIDIEGYEYDLILNEKDSFLKRVNKMAIELHNFGMFINSTEYYSKILNLIEKLSLCGFKISFEHIHKNTNLYMLYVSK